MNEERKPTKRVLSCRYPLDRVEQLEAIQARRGDLNLSDTIAVALDRFIADENRLPKAA